MNSHAYQFEIKWLVKHLGFPLALVAGFALLLHFSAMFLAAPRDTWDMDRTIMAHKADLASTDPAAEVILIGDSSCLMNIDAKQVSELVGKKVINLGTVSFLNLEMFSALLKRCIDTQAKPPSHVIVVSHPDFLRRSSASRIHVDWLETYLSGKGPQLGAQTFQSLDGSLAIPIAHGHLLAWLPRPLSVQFGTRFGFTRDLEDYMDQHNGSALDPRVLTPEDLKGSREYRISSANKKSAPLLRQSLPDSVSLLACLTPLPEGFVDEPLSNKLTTLKAEWGEALQVDRMVDTLPQTLPDQSFASKTHLNPETSVAYSKRFAEAIKPLLASP